MDGRAIGYDRSTIHATSMTAMEDLMNQHSGVLSAMVFFLGLSAAACATQSRASQPPKRPSIEDVRQRYEEELLAIPGVVGIATGICRNEACIVVMVTRRSEELQREIPAAIEGYEVKLLEVGDVRIDTGNPRD